MKRLFTREFYIPKDSEQITPGDSTAVCYLKKPPADGGKWEAAGFSGKRAKPDFHYVFKSEEQARKYIADHFANVKSREAERAAWKATRLAAKCHTVEDVYQKAKAEGFISAAETAICLRATLAKHFPGVKFSVRSDTYSMGCSVDYYWTDGPAPEAVRKIADRFSFAGFDGMIDMKYSVSNWLSQDGSMSLAHSTGTESSRGSNPELIGDPHDPSAVLVRHGADYVHGHRTISEPVKRQLAEKVCRRFGVEYQPGDNLESFLNRTQTRDGEYLSQLVHRASTGALALD